MSVAKPHEDQAFPAIADPWNPTLSYLGEMPPEAFLRHLIRSTDAQFANEYRERSDLAYVEECGRRYGPKAFENLTDGIALSRMGVEKILAILPDLVPFLATMADAGGLGYGPWREIGAERRKPEPNVETYALGHYEQQMVELALLAVADPQTYDLSLLTQQERDAVKGLTRMFASHGSVVVTRTNQED